MKRKDLNIPEEILSSIKKYNYNLMKKFNIYELPKDAVQEGVVAYYEALMSYDKDKGDIDKWIKLNIYNKLRDYYRGEKGLEGEAVVEELHNTTYNIETIFCENILEILKELTPFEKEILLAYLEGDNFTTISKTYNYKRNKVQNIIQTIMNYIKQKVENDGFKTEY